MKVDYQLQYEIEQLKRWKDSTSSAIKEIMAHRDKSVDIWSNADLLKNWQISERTAASLRASGKLEYFKIGGKVYYTREMRENYINEHKSTRDDSTRRN